MELSATNLEIGITAKIRAKIEEEGSVTIPAKLLYNYISNLDPGKIEFTLADMTLEIKNIIVSEKIRKPRRTVRHLVFDVNLKYGIKTLIGAIYRVLKAK